jgi:hypothetical protein
LWLAFSTGLSGDLFLGDYVEKTLLFGAVGFEPQIIHNAAWQLTSLPPGSHMYCVFGNYSYRINTTNFYAFESKLGGHSSSYQ